MNRLPTKKQSKFHNSLLDEASKTLFQANPTKYEPKHRVASILKLLAVVLIEGWIDDENTTQSTNGT